MELFSCVHAILHHKKPAARTKIESEAVWQKKIAQEDREMQDPIQEPVPMVRTMLESSIHGRTYVTSYEQLVLHFPEAAQVLPKPAPPVYEVPPSPARSHLDPVPPSPPSPPPSSPPPPLLIAAAS